jgi:hypothetical protein
VAGRMWKGPLKKSKTWSMYQAMPLCYE